MKEMLHRGDVRAASRQRRLDCHAQPGMTILLGQFQEIDHLPGPVLLTMPHVQRLPHRIEAFRPETRSALLPQVNLGPQYTYVFENPYQSLFPPDPTGSNPFTSTNQWRLGGSASISLLNLSQWARLSASRAATRVTELQLTQQQSLTILTVASAYYDAALTARLVTITEFTLVQAERTLKDVTLGRDVGTQSEFEQLRSRVARDNQIPVVTRARANRDIAATRLKQLLDIPITTEVVLETPLDDHENPAALPADVDSLLEGVDTAAAARAVVRTAQEAVQQNEKLNAAAGRQWIPTMSTTMNYNRAGFSGEFIPAPDEFANDWNLIAVLNWPIFTSGRILGRVTKETRPHDELLCPPDLAIARLAGQQAGVVSTAQLLPPSCASKSPR